MCGDGDGGALVVCVCDDGDVLVVCACGDGGVLGVCVCGDGDGGSLVCVEGRGWVDSRWEGEG